ncbi:MAG: guanylate kinase [Dehalococcoidia bacterium]
MSGSPPAPSRAPLLVVLSGPSGVGKDAVLDELARRGHRFHRVVTCTTRPRRDNETAGVDYHFVTDADFDSLIATGGLLEHAEIYGHRSGVPKAQVAEKLREGLDVYVRTDVQGAASIKRIAPAAVTVFIAPSSLEELEERIRARRSDDDGRIARRLAAARAEMARRAEFDYTITNEPGRLDATATRLTEILEAERLHPHNYTPLLA